jgi:hypothetical protein
MLAIENYTWLTISILAVFSIVPVVSFAGKILKPEGRATFLNNPLIFIYFIIFFAYAYFFWTSPATMYEYLGINYLYQKMIYGALCLVPFFEKDVSS